MRASNGVTVSIAALHRLDGLYSSATYYPGWVSIAALCIVLWMGNSLQCYVLYCGWVNSLQCYVLYCGWVSSY